MTKKNKVTPSPFLQIKRPWLTLEEMRRSVSTTLSFFLCYKSITHSGLRNVPEIQLDLIQIISDLLIIWSRDVAPISRKFSYLTFTVKNIFNFARYIQIVFAVRFIVSCLLSVIIWLKQSMFFLGVVVARRQDIICSLSHPLPLLNSVVHFFHC